ncbi:hypothetical protein QA584_17335 [Anaerocolumna sp. AGMB13025]|uniref:hypothetical protein n=1 Tax=Anaerocolumna sp. AGMB13025 TaxID=3039116 RepID=UPI00241F24E1|nr:hypothetical protein [Anaerocolumna sp. AGMB13025]WFR55364.1 hypothetical protein QA584_17335 [Anaerocolumna sp. AGMB13025]
MGEVLFKNEGEFTPDSLIASAQVGLIVKGAKLAPKQGFLKRGTLIGQADDNLFYITGKDVAEAAVGVTGILTDDTYTGDASATEPIIVTQYVTGVFNKNALYADAAVNITDYEAELRKLGIFLENTI